MSESQHHHHHRTSAPPSTAPRPCITIPQRSPPDIFSTAVQLTSPSPMTIVSNFFGDNFPDTTTPTNTTAQFAAGSFSQLLAGAMSSPGTPNFLGLGDHQGATFGHHHQSSSSATTTTTSSSSPDDDDSGHGYNNNNDSGNGNGKSSSSGGGGGSIPAFKQNRPAGLMVPVVLPSTTSATLFPVSPGFSPSAFFNSPAAGGGAGGFLFPPPPLNSPFGISHQQALAQVQAQAAAAAAALSQSTNYPGSSSTSIQPPPHLSSTTDNHHDQQQQPFIFPAASTSLPSSSSFNPINPNPNHHHQNPPPPQITTEDDRPVPTSYITTTLPIAVDKPADDGFNWRKYGQKPIKGSEYPRSYYKCTMANCPVKKKVERCRDGRITEIIYRGQHNHGKPQPGKRNNRGGGGGGRDIGLIDHGGDSNSNLVENGSISQWSNSNVGGVGGGDEEYSCQDATSLQLHGPSDSEESGEANNNHNDHNEEDDDDRQRDPKRRNVGGGGNGMQEMTILSHKTVTEPKIIVQTRSQVDLLDDGYRWRKYGQKVVKGNPNPRSYYKCTTNGCGVRKHIERSSTDAGAVITTYEGKHNHDIPVGRNGGGGGGAGGRNGNGGNNNNQQARQSNNNNAQQSLSSGHGHQVDFGNQEQQRPIAFLRLKEEQYHR